jgi:hypothetical protein
MTHNLWLVTVEDETAKGKKCGAGSEKIKKQNNAYDEERK